MTYRIKYGLVYSGVILFVFLFSNSLHAQWVKDDDTVKHWLSDGLYLSQMEFLTNSPSLKWYDFSKDEWRKKDSLARKRVLVEVLNQKDIKADLELRQHRVYVVDSGVPKVFDMDLVWGICVNGEAYKKTSNEYNNNFFRIQVIGTISYMKYTVVYQDPFMWSPELIQMENGQQSESVDHIVDFEKREIYARSRRNLEGVLKRDSTLFKQYESEKRKSREVYNYIIEYNKRHPLEFNTTIDSIPVQEQGKP